jgi:hypothetical protein
MENVEMNGITTYLCELIHERCRCSPQIKPVPEGLPQSQESRPEAVLLSFLILKDVSALSKGRQNSPHTIFLHPRQSAELGYTSEITTRSEKFFNHIKGSF